MIGIRLLLLAATALMPPALSQTGHVWEKREIQLKATNSYQNPYTGVTVWVDLKGPGFHKRVYGFWDGGNSFRVRMLATAPGEWSWTSGSDPADPGLGGKTGAFSAVPWTESEKAENLCRRGFVRPTPNGHAFELADGTPFLLLGDTWWSTPSVRFRWTDDDTQHPMGPDATFKDMVRFRRAQGFNSVAMVAAFPNWENDGKPSNLTMNDADHTLIRSAWADPKTKSAKEQSNEGGRPFLFPGRVPGYEDVFADVDRLNPAYFQYLDKKIDYLNSQGFVPFIEMTRRDSGPAWKKYYQWPDSYTRFIEYIFSRYQANNVLLSPVHYDWFIDTIPREYYNQAASLVIDKYGPPAFGTLASTNSNPSTIVNWGHPSWLTFHQTGNQRPHDYYWHMTEIFRSKPAMPGVAGEPYYAGDRYNPREIVPYYAEGGTPRDSLYNRSSMYGNFLSGGFGGHIYGADGIWQANIEPEARVKMWEAFPWESAAQVKYLRTFAFSNGARYRDLEPDADLVTPNKNPQLMSYEGWAFAARTPERDFFLVFLEKGAPQARVRGAVPDAQYQAQWFNPRNGEWSNVGSGVVTAAATGWIDLPAQPTPEDWGLRLLLKK
jgi:Protein of unknown function (DUF4038)/Domain of unknown function (DUF5060)/Putative collagen-binding domain of a collagenase